MNTLPPELLIKIIIQLRLQDIKKTALTCSKFRNVITNYDFLKAFAANQNPNYVVNLEASFWEQLKWFHTIRFIIPYSKIWARKRNHSPFNNNIFRMHELTFQKHE